jgi:hypothetical protein
MSYITDMVVLYTGHEKLPLDDIWDREDKPPQFVEDYWGSKGMEGSVYAAGHNYLSNDDLERFMDGLSSIKDGLSGSIQVLIHHEQSHRWIQVYSWNEARKEEKRWGNEAPRG